MTLREWYDSLSENAKKIIRMECKLWFDETQPDCYKVVSNMNQTVDDCAIYITNNASRYSNDDNKNLFCLMFLNEFKKHSSEEDMQYLISSICAKFINSDNGYLHKDITPDVILMSDDISFRKKMVEKIYTYERYDQKKIEWRYALYLLDDYSDVPKALSQYPLAVPDTIRDGIQEILGEDVVKQLCVEDPQLVGIEYGKQSDMFDACFFCENGWSDDQKKRFIHNRYCHTYSHTIVQSDYQSGFRDFIERVVAVDQNYLRYIYDIIDECPALGNKVYDEKKPAGELTGNEKPDMTFRYSKLIRKLARIANICARKSLSNVNGKFLKEVGPLIKFYGYNFYDIYECIMDDLNNQ